MEEVINHFFAVLSFLNNDCKFTFSYSDQTITKSHRANSFPTMKKVSVPQFTIWHVYSVMTSIVQCVGWETIILYHHIFVNYDEKTKSEGINFHTIFSNKLLSSTLIISKLHMFLFRRWKKGVPKNKKNTTVHTIQFPILLMSKSSKTITSKRLIYLTIHLPFNTCILDCQMF